MTATSCHPKEKKVGKKAKCFCPQLAPGLRKQSCRQFFFLFMVNIQCFSLPFALPDSPEAARGEAIDCLAQDGLCDVQREHIAWEKSISLESCDVYLLTEIQ